MEIIKDRHQVFVRKPFVAFFTELGCGYTFDLDDQRNPILNTPDAKKSYDYCMAHPEKFPAAWNVTMYEKYSWTEPAIGRCDCGQEFPLEAIHFGACQCPKCGRWYNAFGQALLPPEEWEGF